MVCNHMCIHKFSKKQIDGASGQSNMVENYIYNNFQMSYDPTVEDTFIKIVEMDSVKYVLEIVDLGKWNKLFR